MQESDTKYLRAMLKAVEDAIGFVENKCRDDLEKDRQMALSLVKFLEMIGQAASRVSKKCQKACEPIPWEQVIDTKHQVVHTYWEIDLDWVWEKVKGELPSLMSALKEILEKEEVQRSDQEG